MVEVVRYTSFNPASIIVLRKKKKDLILSETTLNSEQDGIPIRASAGMSDNDT